MKRVVSVSLGSSSRDHKVELDVLGQHFLVERIGTNGSIEKAVEIIKELDGKVDAFGMGGIDIYLHGSENAKYMIRSSKPLVHAAVKTPIVDGSELKNVLERRVVYFVDEQCDVKIRNKKVLLVSAIDRFGMAEAFDELGAKLVMGDLIFSLGIPIPITSLKLLRAAAVVLMPALCQLPFSWLYPVGGNQDQITPKHGRFYQRADIIAGDFIYIRKYLPDNLPGKIIITNTVTPKDVELLRERGVKMLVTSTPDLQGRSFGTNVIEAILVAASGKRPEQLTKQDYLKLLDDIGFKPRVENL